MRVMLVAHAFPPTIGGVETHLWDMAHGLAARGHQVCCLVGGRDCAEHDRMLPRAILVRRHRQLEVHHLVRSRRGVSPAERVAALRDPLRKIIGQALAAFRPQILHIHNAHHFAPELAEAAFAECAGAAMINSVHDRVGEHIYPEVLFLPWFRILFASRYLACSLATDRPRSVWHLSIDCGHFTPGGSRDGRLASLQRPIVFHPARLLPWKGILTGVEAFALLRRRCGTGTLILCDSSSSVDDPAEIAQFRREVEDRARAHGVSNHMKILPFSRVQMPPAYRAADLVWYPTTDEEPLGLVPIEAMAMGVPIIVSDSGGMVETVTDGVNGLVVPKNDAGALADAAHEVLSNRLLRNRLVQAARKHSRRFSTDAYVGKLEKLYDDGEAWSHGIQR